MQSLWWLLFPCLFFSCCCFLYVTILWQNKTICWIKVIDLSRRFYQDASGNSFDEFVNNLKASHARLLKRPCKCYWALYLFNLRDFSNANKVQYSKQCLASVRFEQHLNNCTLEAEQNQTKHQWKFSIPPKSITTRIL